MRIAFGADDDNECTQAVTGYLREAGDLEVLSSGSWPEFARAVGQAVAAGRADFGVVMCWTGTGTSIAANKVPGVRAALAWEPWIARNARRWNDANVLALSLRTTSSAELGEILDAWFSAQPSADPGDAANLEHLRHIEQDPGDGRRNRPA